MNGTLEPGSQVIETRLASQFGVSRGPLREAIRQLIDEGLLFSKSYTATFVTELSKDDVREIYSIRTVLETFAFELVWDRREEAFRMEIERRHRALLEAIDRREDEESILAELKLHSLVFEQAGHKLLLSMWNSLRGRLQLYWAAHHRAHGRRGPRRAAHDDYVRLATGNSLEKMKAEITDHMQRGAERTEAFLDRK